MNCSDFKNFIKKLNTKIHHRVMDSHTAHAGFETRIGAFLDIIEDRHRKKSRNTIKLLNQIIAV